MGDERSITDCDYFLEGNCRWGEICLFRHPLNMHQPPILCKYWQSYSCTNVYCKFLHPAVLPPIKKVEPSVATTGPPKSEKVCAFYMSGRCKKSDCPFIHGLPETVSSRHPIQGIYMFVLLVFALWYNKDYFAVHKFSFCTIFKK
jgi:hypothetical protein